MVASVASRIVVLLCCLFYLNENVDTDRPRFNDYPVRSIYKGKPVPPILNTKDLRMYRTMIRLGAKSEVEFAGHYTIPVWGCGSACTSFVIVDSTNGRVYGPGSSVIDLPLAWLEQNGGDDRDRMEYHRLC